MYCTVKTRIADPIFDKADFYICKTPLFVAEIYLVLMVIRLLIFW